MGRKKKVEELINKKLATWIRGGIKLPFTSEESKQLLKMWCLVNASGCWLWQGNSYVSGYGRLSCRMRRAMGMPTERVHVASFILWNGKVPIGSCVCHECDVKLCFNPNHLWAGTNQENQQDAAKKGAWAKTWTEERRAERSAANTGTKNPMYGVRGEDAPCYGRTGSKHPMYGRHHTEESRAKTSATLKMTYRRKSEAAS